MGYPVRTAGTALHARGNLDWNGYDPYAYTLESRRPLSSFNMEQQGDIIADYFAIDTGLVERAGSEMLSASGRKVNDRRKFYEVLREFRRNPKDKALLPSGITDHLF
ncbi:hypothetical protein [Pseudoxanthomonas putridarboris]|uniref:Uncharacterized protein n=1 Tax=Pseudoxanthomonas putridarboris TaxID=752605 RepID=A0ABU9J670_9GAMM